MTRQHTPDTDAPTFWDIVEILRVPALFALVTAAATWLIWYYTNMPCAPELASSVGCNPAKIARYINVDVFGRMLTYSVLVGGIGGLWKYDMIRKERAARIAAQNQLAELQKQREAERQRAEAERQNLLAVLAEERRKSDEDRQAFLVALSEITSELAHWRRERNGDAQNGH